MKKHIDIDQLVVLNPEDILTLSNNPWIDTTWAGWQNPVQVSNAIQTYKEKGWRHDSLLSTARACDASALMNIIGEKGHITVEFDWINPPTRKEWKVSFTPDDSAIFDITQGSSTSLVNALWTVYHRVIKKGLE